MTEQKVVLIVARDLGFTCWLGQALGQAGIQALPAKKVVDGKQLIRDFHLRIDVLVIDPHLEGAGKFAETLRRAPHHARIIGLSTEPEGSVTSPELPIELWKAPPGRSDQQAAMDWVHTIESQLVAA